MLQRTLPVDSLDPKLSTHLLSGLTLILEVRGWWETGEERVGRESYSKWRRWKEGERKQGEERI